jgi:FHS family L-fucose permease-like MFS transporter
MIKKLFTTEDGTNHFVTFLLVTSLFFLWGFGNGMIDVFDKHFQNSLQLTKSESTFVQCVWYAAYFIMAIPSGLIARRFGYRGGILSGLFIVIAGALLFVPVTKIVATKYVVFASFLVAFFLVGSGLAFLETVANPYASVLGRPEHAVVRLNIAQTGNSLGWIFGPIVGGMFVLSKSGVASTSNATLYIPYLIVAVVVAVMAAVFWFAPVPDLHAVHEAHAPVTSKQHARSIFQEAHYVLGIAAQFFYVAAQTGIFCLFINYIRDERYTPVMTASLAGWLPANWTYAHSGGWAITDFGAGHLLSVAFGFFAVGRFTGSILVRYTVPHLTLAFYAFINVVLMYLVYAGLGWVSIFALFLSFFFMSIMYPTQFGLAIRGLGEQTKIGSSYLVMAIAGGSFIPPLMGAICDHYSMGVGFLVPLVCFFFILLYGLFWKRFFAQDMEPVE